MLRSPIALVVALFVSTSLTSAFAAPTPEPSLPDEDAHAGATRAQAVEAFTRDCHATLTAMAWRDEEEVKLPECSALDIQQNCNPDTFGCVGRFDSCQVACQPGCGRCQDSCATSCDGCKAACKADDKACVKRCGEARADCRGTCMDALRQCQGPSCTRAMNTCFDDKKKELGGCDRDKCDSLAECMNSASDSEKAAVECDKKVKGLSQPCRDVCSWRGSGALDDLEYETNAVAEPLAPDASLAGKCTKDASCPADYAAVAPYLGAFCAGTMNSGELAALGEAVSSGAISKRGVSLIFNAYGAIYGYTFKKEKWMNAFFYTGGKWLPSACAAKMKSVAKVKDMPFALTRQRDAVKGFWNEAK